MRLYLAGLVVSSLAAGCATDESTQPLPSTTGSYVGSYRVPTSADLAAAALYPVPDVDWTVANGIATLHYDLPIGLVGGKLSISLSGPIESGATTIMLNGAVGTGSCVAAQTTITCQENFADLGVLPISMAVVEAVAATEYVGPVADRARVATAFSSDPIGIVDFDLQSPVVDDHGAGSRHD